MRVSFSSLIRLCTMHNVWTVVIGLVFSPLANGQESEQQLVEFFEKNVRPLLIEKCIECHSGESGKTNGGLALDSKQGWVNGGDSGPAIVPGDPEKSLLIQAVRYEHAELRMPPADTGGKLSYRELGILTLWIQSGAIDPRESVKHVGMDRSRAAEWWSFQPLLNRDVPEGSEEIWKTSAIDRFVRQQQLAMQVEPNQVADKRSLIRRATFDLTGLPPTIDEIREFEADISENAFAKVVDRLLDSPAYGERWGRHWLEVARYADTAGDGADYPVREAYLYRNWVISAIQRDLPIDDFLSMQLAGDILARQSEIQNSPDLYAEHVTATGFLAIGKRYGYAPNADYQHLDFADAIDSIGRSILGLSIGCARCHDHKYDPLSMEDYYAWYGILQSTQWAFPGGEEHKRPAHFPPLVPPAEATQREAKWKETLTQLDRDLQRLKQRRSRILPGYRAGGVDLDFEQQAVGSPPGKAWLSVGPNQIVAEAQSPFGDVHALGKQGVRLGTGKPNEGIRYVFENGLRSPEAERIFFHIDFRTLNNSTLPGAYRFFLGRGVVASTALDCSITQREIAVKVNGQWKVLTQLQPDQWYSLTAEINPAKKLLQLTLKSEQKSEMFRELGLSSEWDGVIDTFICDAIGHVEGDAPVRDLDNLGLASEPFALTQADSVVAAADSAALAAIEQEIQAAQAARDKQANTAPYPVAYGVVEGKAADATIQKRGEPDKPGALVHRRNLQILGGEKLESTDGSGRLELARWLVRPENPLTARVFVNRVWHWHFGKGIVSTPSDFGLRGELPTHPELLDWLASEFVRSNWSLKHLHRLIMNSRTYQLSSQDSALASQRDPENRSYWKFTRRSLSAEELRDSMLQLSGQLKAERPAGHPFPDVNGWAYTIHNPFQAVYDSNHRSVYLMLQRNQRHPYLALFDAADPNQSAAVRLVSTTPTQSLYLMNSTFVNQQCQGFAARILSSSDEDERRIAWGLEASSGQLPTTSDIEEARQFLEVYQQKLTEVNGQGGNEATTKWAAFARVLLNSNSFLFVD
jgi:hypothetical protein